MAREHLRMTVEDGVAILTLERPEHRNAFSGPMAMSLSDAYREFGLHFTVGDHHRPLEYESGSFDGCYSFQAVRVGVGLVLEHRGGAVCP